MTVNATQLSHEILQGTEKSVAKLLKNDAEINEVDQYGFTPLIEAAIVNSVPIAKLLLEQGAEVNQADMVGRTALHWAADNNNYALSQLLLTHGADSNAYTIAGQPVLVTPLLRQFNNIKKLLYQHGADLDFAKDYINAKLIGHRFELTGEMDLVDHQDQFILFDFEGFVMESTINIIRDSLLRYKNHFTARHLRPYFGHLHYLIQAYDIASELTFYQRYTVDLKQYQHEIDRLLEKPLLILPVAYEGHAITLIKFGNLLAKCDRGEDSRNHGGGIIVYQMDHPAGMNKALMKQLIYTRSTQDYIHRQLNYQLGLQPICRFPLSYQITGNCSWANVEGAVPLALFLLFLRQTNNTDNMRQCEDLALDFYLEWQRWDQDRALDDCLQSFHEASPARQASKAMMLAVVLFQVCTDIDDKKSIERADKILKILNTKQWLPILQSYVNVYYIDGQTPKGEKFVKLLNYCDVDIQLEGKSRIRY